MAEQEATSDPQRAWHSVAAGETLAALGSSESGLATGEADGRLAKDGPNALSAEGGTSLGKLVIAQIADPLVYLLAGAGVVSLLAGKVFDAGVILAIVVANMIIGVVQEYRAEAALEALRRMSSPRARVVRDGAVRLIDATEVVTGDVIVLETGDRVPADARVLSATDLRVDESALTGESDPVEKAVEALAVDTPLADRVNMLYSSTPVVAGRGSALVVGTGMDTIVGQIAGEVRSAQRQESPLQARLAKLSTRLGVLSVAAAVLIFVLGVLRGETLVEMLLFSIAAAVSAIPEGLPTAVSVSLALGVQRMAKRKAVIRRLAAVETLGGCTVVCTDKTGTLTRNQMTVTRMWAGGQDYCVTGEGYSPEGAVYERDSSTAARSGSALGPESMGAALRMLVDVGCRANNAVLEQAESGEWLVEGNPTDGALFAAALKAGRSTQRCDGDRIDEVPFSSAFKYMATLDRTAEGVRLHVKGAPERVLSYCDRILVGSEVVALDERWRDRVRSVQGTLADEALRVVAAAYREMPEATEADRSDAEQGCVFVGLWGLMDPPRAEARPAVEAAQRAGITVKMITGDHAATGAAIARRVGILSADAGDEAVVTGAELDVMDDETLATRVGEIAVFSRVEPRHKLRIVEALQKLGETVSMTGDGVNDAPALKRADIGVAMGITGTEVSKEAADMVLADDDFATIISAVEEGRVIYGNLQRVVAFLLTIALGEVLAIATSQVIGWPLPITPIMVLWTNLVVASALTIPLGIEPKNEDVLAHRPRPRSEDIVNRRAAVRIGVGAVIVAIGMLGVFGYVHATRGSVLHAQTLAFTTLVALEWGQAFGNRSWNVPLRRLGLFSNRSLLVGLLVGIVMQWAAVSSPAAERILQTDPLGPAEWALAVGVGLTGLLLTTLIARLPWARSSDAAVADAGARDDVRDLSS